MTNKQRDVVLRIDGMVAATGSWVPIGTTIFGTSDLNDPSDNLLEVVTRHKDTLAGVVRDATKDKDSECAMYIDDVYFDPRDFLAVRIRVYEA